MKNSSLKNKTFNKVLILQTAFLGDAILSTSLPKALKEIYPNAVIDIVAIPETAEIFKLNPSIRKIHLFDKRNKLKKLPSFLKLCLSLRKEKYDLAISLQVYLTSSFLMLLSKIPIRIGYPRQRFTSHSIPFEKGTPVYSRSMVLLSLLTDQVFQPQTELFWDDNTEQTANNSLKSYNPNNDRIIGIAPGSVWNTKKWLPEYFSELIKLLSKNGIKAVLIGGKEDRKLCQNIIDTSGTDSLNLAGKLNLKGSAAVIQKLQLLISNDSAPLHIANAVKTDVIAIFGPTVKEFGFAPYRKNDEVIEVNLPCRPCGKHGSHECPENHFRCMKDIKPDNVYQTIVKKLSTNQ